MARILLTWELGSGFGHVASLSSIAGALRQQGHEIVAAFRDPNRGTPFFSPLGISCIAAPGLAAPPTPSAPIATYADLLASVGFNSLEELLTTLAGWDWIFDDVEPDVVVFDHSPFALLAAIGRRFGKLQHGTSFYIPPDTNPLPSLRPWLLRGPKEAAQREAHVLTTVNLALAARNQLPLLRLGDLYSTTEHWLATYEELDHFGPGRQATFHGITPPPTDGLRPDWPPGSGPRIFAYLQPDETTLTSLTALVELGYPTIARVLGIKAPSEIAASRSLKLVSESVEVTTLARECDLAVLSGGHGTLAAVLLAGKPVVITPIQFEQLLLAKRCEQAGFGVAAPPGQSPWFVDAIEKVLTANSHGDRARQFAARYRSFDLQDQLHKLAVRIEQLASSG